MPRATTAGTGATWAAADNWNTDERYVPDGADGDTVVMVWRRPTQAEVTQAAMDREQRWADEYHDDDPSPTIG